MNQLPLLPTRIPRGSLLRRALVQSLLQGVFIVSFLTLVSFLILRGVVSDVAIDLERTVDSAAWNGVEGVLRGYGLLDGSIFRSTLALIAGLMLLSSALLAYLLARSLTEPIRTLTGKVRQLSPGTWQFRSSLHTGDEVEVLDRTIADLTGRLKAVYDHLEDEVAQRTSQLKDQYAMDRAVLESVSQGVISVDDEGKVMAINPAALHMIGLAEEAALGKRVARILPLDSRGRKSVDAEHLVDTCLRTQRESRTTPDEHVSLERADHLLLPVLVHVTPLLVENALRGAVAVIQDMTQERQVDYMKSEFISLASHQLRTPLSSLRWYGELLSEEKSELTTDQRQYVSEIRNATSRMLNLLNALLHAARLEEQGIQPQHEDMDLTEFVCAVGEDAKQLAGQAGLRCEISLPAAPLRAFTDQTLLGIVLQNLVSNAVKYTPKGKGIRIELRVRGKEAEIAVSDEGLGIPQSEFSRVFEKFFRAANVRTVDTDGNGLGLYISKSIMEKLDGSIRFESEEGKGTTFTVVVPLKKTTI